MVKGIIPQTHLKNEAIDSRYIQDSWGKHFEEKNFKIVNLCSHSDVGYWGDASTGLWLFVFCSSLFKHLLPLTKRHNTPADNTSVNCQNSDVYTSCHLWIYSFWETYCLVTHVISCYSFPLYILAQDCVVAESSSRGWCSVLIMFSTIFTLQGLHTTCSTNTVKGENAATYCMHINLKNIVVFLLTTSRDYSPAVHMCRVHSSAGTPYVPPVAQGMPEHCAPVWKPLSSVFHQPKLPPKHKTS